MAYSAGDVVASGAELGVVVAYGRLIKADVLGAVPMLNVHFSLLPRWRGAAPLERAVLAGDKVTGVCLMALDEGLDTGPVYACEQAPIEPDETVDQLRRRLGEMGTAMLLRALSEGLGAPQPQVGEATYASKIDPGELRLDFSEPAERSQRAVRVGRAWTTWNGRRLLVHRARVLPGSGELSPGEMSGTEVGTGEGSLELLVVQPEGKPAMDAGAWVRGARPSPGARLGL